jgi:hypothetical protein
VVNSFVQYDLLTLVLLAGFGLSASTSHDASWPRFLGAMMELHATYLSVVGSGVVWGWCKVMVEMLLMDSLERRGGRELNPFLPRHRTKPDTCLWST